MKSRNIIRPQIMALRKRRRRITLAAAFALGCIIVHPVYGASEIAGYIMASSVLYETGYDYGPWCAMDHDISTAWTEGMEGPGYGQSLFFETDPYTVITGGTICPGFYASEDLFYKNNAPTRIYIHTGTQEAYLDVTEYASAYQEGFSGFHFLFDEPLVSDGSVTMTIVGVRSGWKYDDTCISELRLEGYQASADTVPVRSDSTGTPHVSLVLPDQDYDGFDDTVGNPFLNPDGIGGDGRGPDEIATGTADPEYLDEMTQLKLTNIANQLYRLHSGEYPEAVTIRAGELYSYSRAYILNWYQSSGNDSRIIYNESRDWNYASEQTLRTIAQELFDTPDPDMDVRTLCDYFGASREGDRIRLNAGGNGWNDRSYFLEDPVSAGFIYGRTLLMGNVMTYDADTGTYEKVMVYYAYFNQDPYDSHIFRFDELYVTER